ncbi:NUDIX hydrolase [Archangium lipolyticum]|uniref:NUDIX hydrolase n=1 Tax=Archangium lipolyticum TaxID=2970465 RepID=UPI00214A44E0|nr:NUDIX hydrolase [Archangium lipolyticum]
MDLLDPLVRTAYRGAYTLARAYWFVRRPRTEGTLVGIWHGREVLLLRNSYKQDFSMPGGGRHPGESPQQTGARELREEVGLRVSPGELREVFETRGTEEFKRDRCHFVELEVQTRPTLTLDNREVVWAEFIDLDTALRLPLAQVVRAYLEHAARRRGPTGQRDTP